MKSLIVILSMVVAGTAYAGPNFEAMTWSQILKDGRYKVDPTNKIHFQKGSVWVNSMSSKLCTDGNFIYGGTFQAPVYDPTSDDSKVVGYKTIDLVQPVVSERQRCAATSNGDEGDCVAYETVVYTQSPNRTIKILDATQDEDDNTPRVLGTKSYTIPSCASNPPIDAN